MQSLDQAARRSTSSAGRPLPDIMPSLTARGIRPRRGQVMMVAGPPNGGKSFLGLWYCVKHNLPTLYISADTDQSTTLYRALAMLTEDKVDNVEAAFEYGAEGEYLEALEQIKNVRFTFESAPTVDDIAQEVLAYEELYGAPPSLVIVDNLLNIVGEGTDGWAGMVDVSKFLHKLARVSEASVWVLHHTSESAGNVTLPASRKAVLNKANQIPEVILTVAMDAARNQYHVACVKNRSGPHDASGKTFTSLYTLPSRMQLYEDASQFQMATTRFSYA